MSNRTVEMTNAIVMIVVAVVVFAMVLMPMVDTAINETIDGEEQTITNTASAYYAPYTGTEDIELSYTLDTTTVTNSSAFSEFVLNDRYISISGSTITVWDSTGKNVIAADWSYTITAANLKLVDNADSNGATYGMWTSLNDLNVEGDAKLYVYNDTSYASETYNGTGIALTTITTEYKDVYEVTAIAGDNGGIFAPIEVVYYEQIPAIDENLKTIIGIVPILVIIGVIMGCAYLFIGNGRA